jgi:hypothetical protein
VTGFAQHWTLRHRAIRNPLHISQRARRNMPRLGDRQFPMRTVVWGRALPRGLQFPVRARRTAGGFAKRIAPGARGPNSQAGEAPLVDPCLRDSGGGRAGRRLVAAPRRADCVLRAAPAHHLPPLASGLVLVTKSGTSGAAETHPLPPRLDAARSTAAAGALGRRVNEAPRPWPRRNRRGERRRVSHRTLGAPSVSAGSYGPLSNSCRGRQELRPSDAAGVVNSPCAAEIVTAMAVCEKARER